MRFLIGVGIWHHDVIWFRGLRCSYWFIWMHSFSIKHGILVIICKPQGDIAQHCDESQQEMIWSILVESIRYHADTFLWNMWSNNIYIKSAVTHDSGSMVVHGATELIETIVKVENLVQKRIGIHQIMNFGIHQIMNFWDTSNYDFFPLIIDMECFENT